MLDIRLDAFHFILSVLLRHHSISATHGYDNNAEEMQVCAISDEILLQYLY